MSCFTVQPIRIATSTGDESGLLVLIDRRLAAVLSRLEASYHGEARGSWFLEAGFGECAVPPPEPHHHLREALHWIADHMGAEAEIAETELDEIERRFSRSPNRR